MAFDENELAEFKSEALDLIEEAEKNLLEVESGHDFQPRYDAIFRCFHSLKGAAGMLELENLRMHMHHLEDLFATFQQTLKIAPIEITFFLEGIDATKRILDGETVAFNYELPTLKIKSVAETSEKAEVFIIDDEEDLVEILGGYMTKCGLSWRGFTDPQEAVKAFEQNLPSLVMSDLKMPKMNGLEVLKKLREHSKEVPLIIISAQLNKEALLEAISNGVSAVIEKPFREGQVAAQVTQSLVQSELNQLLNNAIEVLMFQMPYLEKFLEETNKIDVLHILKKDISQLLQKRRQIRELSKRLKK